MNPINKAVTNIIQINSVSKGDKDHYCPYCEELIPKLKINILGQKKIVQPKCACEVKVEEEKLQRLVNAGEKREAEKRFALNSLGDRFTESTFKNFDMRLGSEKAFEMAYRYAQEFNDWGADSLLIWGDYGNGKSHLAASIAKELNDRGKIVIFQSVPELLERIRSTFGKNSKESETEILSSLQMCDLLMLDDIGAENIKENKDGSSWVQEIVFRIIDKRYRKKKPILYTSNLKPSMLLDKLGGRIYDRITETSLTIENKASSYRRQKAEERFRKYKEGIDG